MAHPPIRTPDASDFHNREKTLVKHRYLRAHAVKEIIDDEARSRRASLRTEAGEYDRRSDCLFNIHAK